MPLLVQETYHANNFSEKHIFVKVVKDIETVQKLQKEINERFQGEATWVFENYSRWLDENSKERNEGTESNKIVYLNAIKKYCDLDILDDLMEEIMEDDLTYEQKYKLAISVIIGSFFCLLRYNEISDWDTENEIIFNHYIDTY